METKRIREKIVKIREEAEGLVKHLLQAESRGGLGTQARAELLKRLEDRRYALRTYESYLNDVEDHESDASARQETLKDDLRVLENRTARLKLWLTREVSRVPAFHPSTSFALTLYILDYKAMVSEKQGCLNQLIKLSAA